MKFTFICEDEFDGKTESTVIECESVLHDVVTRRYVDFLRGCGFVLEIQADLCSFDINDVLNPLRGTKMATKPNKPVKPPKKC